MTTITITIASVPDRDNLVAELWVGDQQLGEVSKDAANEFQIELYPAPTGAPWKFRVGDLSAALIEAEARLGAS